VCGQGVANRLLAQVHEMESSRLYLSANDTSPDSFESNHRATRRDMQIKVPAVNVAACGVAASLGRIIRDATGIKASS